MVKRLENLTEKLVGKGKRALTIGLAASAISMLPGCIPSDSLLNKGKSKFFTCNYWIDKDQDGFVDNNEFVGKNKKVFRINEAITLVAYLPNKVGEKIKLELYDWDNKKLGDQEEPGRGKNEFKMFKFPPGKFYESGIGEYTANWYVNNTLVFVNKFTVIQ